jgi:hypothetical protein
MSKTERPYRIDFNVHSREIIEIYEVSPDGSQVRTKDGWGPAYKEGVICQRPPHEPGFVTPEQIEAAIIAERELLREKKYKHTAGYIVAQRYPIKEWLEDT